MRCPRCHAWIPRPDEEINGCSRCDRVFARTESVLRPIGPLAQLIDQTSTEDFALLLIALNRRDAAGESGSYPEKK